MDPKEIEARVRLLEAAVKLLAERLPYNGPGFLVTAIRAAAEKNPELTGLLPEWEAWAKQAR